MHVHDALAQIRALQRLVIERQRFKGYSGRARALGGVVALLATALMTSAFFPPTPFAHLMGWGTVCAVAMALNYGALFFWRVWAPTARRDWRILLPAIDPLASIFVGGVLTLAMILRESHDPLFGIWMCLFGLANLSSRWVLPWAIWPLGIFYILAGSVCLLAPVSFLNPWPMGIVFGVGELAGGLIFHYNREPAGTFQDFLAAPGPQERA